MSTHAVPALVALFVWWFATGVVLMLDGLPRRSYRWSLVISGALAVAGLALVARSAADASPVGAYTAFGAALLVWGWLELSFLTGLITGPRKVGCEPGCSEGRRFVQATQAILYHELALLAGFALLGALTWRQTNSVALSTFAVLWVMRLSAKLNLFLGVRNLSEEFLPKHLAYLQGYFRRRRMNLLLPISLIAAGAVALSVGQDALAARAGSFEATQLTLVATLLVLGMVEHLFMVLPFSASALWRGWLGKEHLGVPIR
jgi:putative photosynthetic complex assembly protein 2